jgi:hypothetical protein
VNIFGSSLDSIALSLWIDAVVVFSPITAISSARVNSVRARGQSLPPEVGDVLIVGVVDDRLRRSVTAASSRRHSVRA